MIKNFDNQSTRGFSPEGGLTSEVRKNFKIWGLKHADSSEKLNEAISLIEKSIQRANAKDSKITQAGIEDMQLTIDVIRHILDMRIKNV